MTAFLIPFFLMLASMGYTHHADIQGNTKIRGKLNLSDIPDSSNVFIGNKVGLISPEIQIRLSER